MDKKFISNPEQNRVTRLEETLGLAEAAETLLSGAVTIAESRTD